MTHTSYQKYLTCNKSGGKSQSLSFYTSAVLDLSNISNAEEEETVCYSSMQRSSVRTATRFYTENTSKKDLVRQLGGISIGHTLVVTDINFDQKR